MRTPSIIAQIDLEGVSSYSKDYRQGPAYDNFIVRKGVRHNGFLVWTSCQVLEFSPQTCLFHLSIHCAPLGMVYRGWEGSHRTLLPSFAGLGLWAVPVLPQLPPEGRGQR